MVYHTAYLDDVCVFYRHPRYRVNCYYLYNSLDVRLYWCRKKQNVFTARTAKQVFCDCVGVNAVRKLG